jgi:hypothetical protein
MPYAGCGDVHLPDDGIASAERDTEAEKTAFLTALVSDGYAGVGMYKAEKMIDGVYHMGESTVALPGGATDADGNMNNPFSIYFIVEGSEVLIVDNGNTATGNKEIDATGVRQNPDRTGGLSFWNYAFTDVPSGSRASSQAGCALSHGYCAAAFSFTSMPQPGLSLAQANPSLMEAQPSKTSRTRGSVSMPHHS